MAISSLAAAGPAVAGAGRLSARARYVSGPDTFMPLPCPGANSDGIPPQGTCLGTGTGAAVYRGRFKGRSTYTYGYSVDAAGRYYAESTELFVGLIRGCGSGTALFVSEDVVGTDAIGHANWVIRAGTGTGALARLSGLGTGRTTYDAAGRGHGRLSGTLSCG